MTVVERCMMISESDPSEWSPEVLHPIPKETVSVFGFQHVAIERGKSITLIEALEWTGLCESKGEARKAIRNNGVRVNRRVVTDINRILTMEDILPNLDAIVLEFGKFNFSVIEMC